MLIGGRGRHHPFALVIRKVRERHRPAERVRLGDDRLGYRALVEDVAALLLDHPEGVRQVGVSEDRADRGRSVVDVVGIDRVRIELGTASLERQGVRQAPTLANLFRNGKAVLRVVNGRLQDLLKRHRAESVEHLLPAPQGPWHGHGEDAP